jgi:hypothetical protein
MNKEEKQKISEYYSKLGKKSAEARKKKILAKVAQYENKGLQILKDFKSGSDK